MGYTKPETLRAYKQSHKAEIRVWENEYRKRNRDRILVIKHREYYKNRERYKQGSKEYRVKHKERLNAYKRNIIESLYIYALDIICQSQEHRCKLCGESDLRCLQFDYINGNGRNEARSYGRLYVWIRNNPEQARQKFQILCCNCNWRKRWINNEFGRKTKREVIVK